MDFPHAYADTRPICTVQALLGTGGHSGNPKIPGRVFRVFRNSDFWNSNPKFALKNNTRHFGFGFGYSRNTWENTVDPHRPRSDRAFYCGRNFLDSSVAAEHGERTRRRGLEGDQHDVVCPLLPASGTLFPAVAGQDGGASTHRCGLEVAGRRSREMWRERVERGRDRESWTEGIRITGNRMLGLVGREGKWWWVGWPVIRRTLGLREALYNFGFSGISGTRVQNPNYS